MSLKEIPALMANLRQAKAEQLQAMNSTGVDTIKATKNKDNLDPKIDSSLTYSSGKMKKVSFLLIQ